MNKFVKRIGRKLTIVILAVLVMTTLWACGVQRVSNIETNKELIYDHSMDLKYAIQFGVDYYKNGYKIITIHDEEKFLLVPEGKEVLEVSDDITVIKQPLMDVYQVSSSVMDLILAIGGEANVKFTGTKLNEWYIDDVKALLDRGDILYAGKYSAPDYEMILSSNCNLAIENTMIYHTPQVKEKLEELGIPVLVEYSSMENHPLGRMEWIKLYGALFDKEQIANEFFDKEIKEVEQIDINDNNLEKKVAYFSVNSNGTVCVRKSGDYISKMIEIAGGRYIFEDLTDENALSTMNIQMESFIEAAEKADYLVYNSTIQGEIDSIEQLLVKCPELKDSKAVKEGNVWCTKKNMYQETTGISDMILDMHGMLTNQNRKYCYLTKIS